MTTNILRTTHLLAICVLLATGGVILLAFLIMHTQMTVEAKYANIDPNKMNTVPLVLGVFVTWAVSTYLEYQVICLSWEWARQQHDALQAALRA